jgi:hypothetical protein
MASAYLRSKGEGFENVFQVNCIHSLDFLLISNCGHVSLVCIFNDSLLLWLFQLYGGIQRYLEQFPDGGYFDGKNFVFDHRLSPRSLMLSC